MKLPQRRRQHAGCSLQNQKSILLGGSDLLLLAAAAGLLLGRLLSLAGLTLRLAASLALGFACLAGGAADQNHLTQNLNLQQKT